MTDGTSTGAKAGEYDHGSTTDPTHRVTGDRTQRPIRVFYPEYGPVEAVLGLGVFYLVVDVATPVLVETLAEPMPGLVPEPLTTLTAASVWVVAGLVVFATAVDQWQANPREFESRKERDHFLDASRPDEWRYYAYAGVVLVGATVAYFSWDTFQMVLERSIVTVVEADASIVVGTLDAEVVVFVAFFLGTAAVTRGIDRIVVGSIREFAYRWHRDRAGRSPGPTDS